MSDETHAGERTAAEPPQAEMNQSDGRGLLSGWSPSTYVVVFAYLYLGGTTLAMVVTTSTVANQLSKIGILLLVVGLLLRIIEYAAGQQATDRIRPWLRRHLIIPNTQKKMSSEGGHHATQSGLAVTTNATTRAITLARRWSEKMRGLVGSVAVYTFVGGLVLVLWQWLDPKLYPSTAFLAGWLFALGTLLSVYVALESSEG